MRLPRKIAGRRLPSLAVKLKPTSSVGLRDILSTFLVALQQSADAFPPLKSAVGGVLAVVDITQRAKHCKSDAQHIARRANEILDLIADAVPDGSAIPPPMELRIERFTTLLNETHATMKAVALTSRFSRFTHLNRNEAVLQGIKLQLDDAYRDFLVQFQLPTSCPGSGYLFYLILL
ncbi:hypothetical protein B0H16DRAFT_506330 [Mycena metata]|uniref:Uncharacterized protein n=1 Tax=Mycena metata TaxID=1033252 RepID=A0AAD7JE97_9AGAR|nr:hypothetical protein B0H16DRAFT_506330 [Mycena metata]